MMKILLEVGREMGLSPNFDKTKLMINAEKMDIKVGSSLGICWRKNINI